MPRMRVPLRLGEKQTMQDTGDGGIRHIRRHCFSVQGPGQNLMEIRAMHIPAEDRNRYSRGSRSRSQSRHERAPRSALQKENKEQDREDFAGCGDPHQHAGQHAKASQVSPARANDQQQKKHIELAKLQIPVERKA